MGTGKTVVARALAARLNMRYVSLDSIIEQRQNRSIAEIFAKEGEEYFRELEKEAVRDVSLQKNVVVDAGGGVVIKKENVKNLKKNGIIVCLAARPEIILERTSSHKHRPLLNVADPEKRIEKLLLLRAPFYKKANFTIDTSDISIEQVVVKIEEMIAKNRQI